MKTDRFGYSDKDKVVVRRRPVIKVKRPRDGDGDGFIYDGTPRMRPVVVDAIKELAPEDLVDKVESIEDAKALLDLDMPRMWAHFDSDVDEMPFFVAEEAAQLLLKKQKKKIESSVTSRRGYAGIMYAVGPPPEDPEAHIVFYMDKATANDIALEQGLDVRMASLKTVDLNYFDSADGGKVLVRRKKAPGTDRPGQKPLDTPERAGRTRLLLPARPVKSRPVRKKKPDVDTLMDQKTFHAAQEAHRDLVEGLERNDPYRQHLESLIVSFPFAIQKDSMLDMDVENLQALANAGAEFSALYPDAADSLGSISFEDHNPMGAMAAIARKPTRSDLWVYPGFGDKSPEATRLSPGWLVVDSAEEAYWHEFGHLVHNHAVYGANGGTVLLGAVNEPIKDAYTRSYYGWEAAGFDTKRDLSNYAGKNYHEFFAEVWSSAHKDGKLDRERVHPGVRELLDVGVELAGKPRIGVQPPPKPELTDADIESLDHIGKAEPVQIIYTYLNEPEEGAPLVVEGGKVVQSYKREERKNIIVRVKEAIMGKPVIKVRRVRTPAGAKRFGVPIGTPITPGMDRAVRVRRGKGPGSKMPTGRGKRQAPPGTGLAASKPRTRQPKKKDGPDPQRVQEVLGISLTPKRIKTIQSSDTPLRKCANAREAVEGLNRGERVELPNKHEVSVLLDELKSIVDEAIAKGEQAPVFDLCKVTVKDTSIFCVESKGIPRIRMPQLSGKPTPGTKAAKKTPDRRGEVSLEQEFRAHLQAKGVKITDTRKPAINLKASQNELNGGKVAGIAGAIMNDDYDEARLFVSRDDYIVDGHHRWAATLGVDLRDGNGGKLDIPVAEIDMDILSLLIEANDFAEAWGIAQASVSKAAVAAVKALLGR